MDGGEILLAFSLMAILFSIWALLAGVRKRSTRLLQYGEWGVYFYFLMLLFSSMLLLSHLLSKDFSYIYVYKHTNSFLPLIYTVSAFWAGKEGSILLWALFIATANIFVLSEKKDALTASTLSISGMFLAILNVFLLTTSNPFIRTVAKSEGFGLNPLLRTFEMVIHPPTVFIAYAGFLIPFAIVVSGAFLGGEWREKAIVRSVKYSFFSWIFLGFGIFIGAYWAYKTLGWGGFWGWDPVENASLMPWLTSTAFIHSIMLRKRKIFDGLSFFLIVATFSLVIFASVVTRGGFINSVHAFGEGEEGIILFILMIGFIILSVFAYFKNYEKQAMKFNLSINRETAIILFLIVTLMLLIAVLAGTVTPVFTNTSPEREYYESIMVFCEFLILLILGICIRISWRRDDELIEKMRVPFIIMILAFLSTLALTKNAIISIFAGVSAFTFLNHFIAITIKKKRDLRVYGAFLVHIGVIILFAGSIGVWDYSEHISTSIALNETLQAGDYTLVPVKVDGVEKRDSFTVFVEIEVYKNGELLSTLKPGLTEYMIINPNRIVSDVAIASYYMEDIYVSITGFSSDFSRAGIEVFINRLTILVWVGMALITAGGVCSYLSLRKD
jgi:cytochrome c-type biogenesis protein CcmF